MAANLTNKQRPFIDYYFICGMNGTEAARRAGYSGDSGTLSDTAHRNLKNPAIVAHIDARLDKIAMTANEVLTRLAFQAGGTFADFVSLLPDPETNKPALRLDLERAYQNGKLHLVKKLTQTERTIGDTTVRQISIELYNAQAALELLGKYHRLFATRVELADWRVEAAEMIRKGEVTYPALVEEFGNDLATELFKQAGVPIPLPGETVSSQGEKS